MRYAVVFVLGLAVLASPLNVHAQETSTGQPWLKSELDFYGPEMEGPGGSIGGTDAEQTRPAFASIPSHLKARHPKHRHEHTPLSPPGRKEPEPNASGLSRGARIGLGVGISVVLVGVAVGVAAAVTARNIEVF